MRFRSLFITGTDTGVGKTTVSCALATALRSHGLRVGVMKPAETGCLPDEGGRRLVPEDALALKAASDCRAGIETICPYTFPDPLAPSVAAARVGKAVDPRTIEDCLRQIEADHDITLVEGAGGLLVPLTSDLTFADLALRLQLRAVVVVGSKLGAINHALLTIRHIEAIGLPLAGYVVNFPLPADDLAATSNVEVLRHWLGEPLAIMPYGGSMVFASGGADLEPILRRSTATSR